MKKTIILAAFAALSLPALASVPQQPAAPQVDELQAQSNHGGQRCYRDANGNKVCVPTKKS